MELWSAPVEGEWLDSRLPRGWPPSSGLRALLITLHLCKGMVMVMVVSVGSDLCSASQGKKPGILYRVGYNRGQAWTSTILSRRLLKSTLFKRSAHGTRLLAGAPARNNANGGHVRVCVLDSAWTQCKCGGLARGPCPWQLLGMSTLALSGSTWYHVAHRRPFRLFHQKCRISEINGLTVKKIRLYGFSRGANVPH